jgi:hypothetical protein
MRTIFLIILAITLSQCAFGRNKSAFGFKSPVGAPWKQKLLKEGPENSPPKFKKGWQDGCETGTHTYGNTMQRETHRFRQDSSLMLDKEYYAGWRVGHDYCNRYTWHWNDTELFPGDLSDGL